jgi:hypothetical protein
MVFGKIIPASRRNQWHVHAVFSDVCCRAVAVVRDGKAHQCGFLLGKFITAFICSHDAVMQCLGNRFTPAIHMQLCINIADMAPDRINTDEAGRRDHFVAESLDQVLQYLGFPRGKIILQPPGSRNLERLQHFFGNGRGERGATVQYMIYRFQ